MNDIIGTLPHLVDGFTGKILSYAILLASIATITMTFLELIKALFKWRLSYHKDKVETWLSNGKCFEQLLILTVAEVTSADALFDQPTDKMMGQVQAATNVVIDFPEMYPDIYSFLTKVPNSEAASRETGGSGRTQTENTHLDGDVWKAFITQTDPSNADVQEATRARARIDHFVARKLDAFQTRTEYQWARKNQYWSVTISSVLIFGLLIYMATPILLCIVLGFFGGMMAPLAKDVVSALSGLRTK